ncbi:LOW QUALITY PROTEIN: hypothetical protein CVT25_001702 [Psilocybe cyanescens]|uniref:Uncharacterized protein n=1 Tax=Psilocybe cyanescens TaxID=93625 RepID=A0A409XHH0_PSICY|nr:LOW QUALITY PROTEIN: hypothetical protein CVT25_001702 [Psilocybe cyanescens]
MLRMLSFDFLGTSFLCVFPAPIGIPERLGLRRNQQRRVSMHRHRQGGAGATTSHDNSSALANNADADADNDDNSEAERPVAEGVAVTSRMEGMRKVVACGADVVADVWGREDDCCEEVREGLVAGYTFAGEEDYGESSGIEMHIFVFVVVFNEIVVTVVSSIRNRVNR